MKSKVIVPIAILVVALGIVGYLIARPMLGNGGVSGSALAEFGKCLASKGATMYGAEWCPHCQNEKKTLGEAFKEIAYVECPEQTQTCIAKGIEGYPTWILGDGTKLVGEQGLAGLSTATGCSLPQ